MSEAETMTPIQCRGARAMLGWSRDELAVRSGVARQTLADFETDKRQPYERTLQKIARTFEEAGIALLPAEPDGDPGVRLRATSRTEQFVPDDGDEHYVPRGQDHHLERALAELMGDLEFDHEEREEAEALIVSLATEFNRASVIQAEGTRVRSVDVQLARIEEAAAELTEAFGDASQETLLALHGIGVGGFRRSFWQQEQAHRYQALCTLSGRYHLPYGPVGDCVHLTDILSTPDVDDPVLDAQNLEWPVAAAALSESVRMRREQFVAEIHRERERFEEVLHRGPDGDLRPARSKKAAAKRPRHNDPSTTPDLGGRQNVSDWTRGPPKWILARDCYSLLAQWQSKAELTGAREGRVYRFTLEVYALATGEDTSEVETPGCAYDAGLSHHVKNAARICAARSEIDMSRNQADPFAPLASEYSKKCLSLEYAYQRGEVPAWLS